MGKARKYYNKRHTVKLDYKEKLGTDQICLLFVTTGLICVLNGHLELEILFVLTEFQSICVYL